MDSVTMFAGLDYHQDSIQVCVMDSAGRMLVNKACENSVEAVASLLKGAGAVESVALEACCGAQDFGEKLSGLGAWRVDLAHAGYVAKLKGSPDKTDFSDSRLVADLLRVGYLPRVWLAPADIRDLRQLVHHRQRLVNQRRDLKLQIGACLREQRVKVAGTGRWSKRWVAAVKDHAQLTEQVRWIIHQKFVFIEQIGVWIKDVEKRLQEASGRQALTQKLRTIEGVGEVTAWTLLAYIGRFDRFKNGKQLSRYCGLSPRNASSGNKQADAGLVNGCNKDLRAVLIQAAQRLARTDPRWKALAQKMTGSGKPKSLVIAAVANRWVRSMHHRLTRPEDEVAANG
jgi:transposase